MRYAEATPTLLTMELLSVANGLVCALGLFLWYRSGGRDRRAVLLFMAMAVVHLYSTSLYYGSELLAGLPNVDTSSFLDSWIKFGLANASWLVFPPFVLAAGLFVLLRAHVDVFGVGIYIVILINAFIALPFVIRILSEPMMRLAREQDRLCLSLGIAGWRRFHLIDWPNLRRAAGLALAIAATLSAGDLSVIALFGSQNFTTLPLLLYQRMSSYRMEEAAVVAVLLTALCFMLFLLLERLLGGPRRA
jgi:thiamine transport system permease protein